jgi:RHS repeat-associated protein
VVRFEYDAMGRRVSKSCKGKTTRWVWDGNVPLHEWTELALNGTNTDELITWLFETDSFAPLAKLTPQAVYSVVSDHLGTPLELHDGQGWLHWAAELDSYGAVRHRQNDVSACPFRYQGQYEDVEIGLYYNRFRYYDPEAGQYISQDPIGLVGGNALYDYVSSASNRKNSIKVFLKNSVALLNMSFTISLSQPIDSANIQPRIGGEALLPDAIAWPHNPKSEHLVLVASLPSRFLNKELGYSLPDDTFVSIFTTYNKNDYFLDVITYAGTEEELTNLRAGYTRVLVHVEGNARNESEYLVPAHHIELSPLDATEEAHYTGSKFAGHPGLLQQEEFPVPELTYVLQLYSSDFPEDFEDIFYLTDAVGYLFLKPQATPEDSEAGLFFVQAT